MHGRLSLVAARPASAVGARRRSAWIKDGEGHGRGRNRSLDATRLAPDVPVSHRMWLMPALLTACKELLECITTHSTENQRLRHSTCGLGCWPKWLSEFTLEVSPIGAGEGRPPPRLDNERFIFANPFALLSWSH